MEIASASLPRTTIPVSQIVRAQYSPSRIGLPVRKGQQLYSSFSHVYGVPSNSDTGYSVSKLRALDNMIDRLEKLGVKVPGLSSLKTEKAEASGVDSMITRLAENIHHASLQQNRTGYGFPGVETGLLINMTV